MIHQINIISGLDKVETAIKRFQTFEPEEGYYLAFSGGKDSVVIKALADMAGVKYDAHYNVSTVDPPELVRFIKDQHPDVKREIPHDKNGKPVTMWSLIANHAMPPTRKVRYCCAYLKEGQGAGRFTVTGVRWAESVRRRNKRAGLEIETGAETRELADPDNPDNAEMARYCPTKGAHILNPIVDWTDAEVWEFIREYNVPYCELYNEGFTRLGCIGCPMAGRQQRLAELARWPKYKTMYLHAFERMIARRERIGLKTDWETGEDVFDWWLKDKGGDDNA